MLRAFSGIIAATIALSLVSTAMAATRHKPPHKRHTTNHSVPGYGFLPGVRTPQQIERERARRYYASGPHFYGPAIPGFYRGRWNGGGFGPCYTQTPIGYQWNCGR